MTSGASEAASRPQVTNRLSSQGDGVPKVLICYPWEEDERESNPNRKEVMFQMS